MDNEELKKGLEQAKANIKLEDIEVEENDEETVEQVKRLILTKGDSNNE